ncbi:hypothetical protein PSFL6913_18325 [Pseudomonas fluorescens]
MRKPWGAPQVEREEDRLQPHQGGRGNSQPLRAQLRKPPLTMGQPVPQGCQHAQPAKTEHHGRAHPAHAFAQIAHAKKHRQRRATPAHGGQERLRLRNDFSGDTGGFKPKRHQAEEQEHQPAHSHGKPHCLAKHGAYFRLAPRTGQRCHLGRQRDQRADRNQHRQPHQRCPQRHGCEGDGAVMAGNHVVDHGNQPHRNMPHQQRQHQPASAAHFLKIRTTIG